MTEGLRLDERTVRLLESAVDRGDAGVIDLLKRAAAQAAERAPPVVASLVDERRLGDRILWALELALGQENLEVAEHLVLAFEAAMTRFGGPEAVEQRELPEGMLRVYEGLDALRRRRYQV